jgi:hypothetical protein
LIGKFSRHVRTFLATLRLWMQIRVEHGALAGCQISAFQIHGGTLRGIGRPPACRTAAADQNGDCRTTGRRLMEPRDASGAGRAGDYGENCKASF